MRYRGISGDRAREGLGGLEPFTADTNLSNGWHRRNQSARPLFERAGGRRGPSVGAPIRRTVRLCAVLAAGPSSYSSDLPTQAGPVQMPHAADLCTNAARRS